MKKTVHLILTLCFMVTIQNCNSQDIDLAKLDFTENVGELLEGIEHQLYTDRFTPEGMTELRTTQLQSFNFKGVNLQGSQVLGRSERASGSKSTNRASLMFYQDDPDSTLQVYSLKINTTSESQKLYKKVKQKYGEPVYSDGKALNIKSAESTDTAVFYWEVSKSKAGVFLRQDAFENENPHEVIITTSLYIFKNTPEISKEYDPRLYN